MLTTQEHEEGRTRYVVPWQASLAQWHAERAVELGRARLTVLLGGIGSGKTAGGVNIQRRVMSEWAPGGRSMIITPSYRTFSQVTLPEIRRWWPGEGHLWRFYHPENQPQLEWYWADGKRQATSVCVIRSAQDARTVEEIRGPTLCSIWGDEVGTWNAGQMAHDLAFGRLRQTAPAGLEDVWGSSSWWPRAFYTGSPRWGWLNRMMGVKGRMPPHAWVTGFYPQSERTGNTPETAIYVRATKTEENVHNGPGYAAMLRLQYGESFADQELNGDFVSPTGAVYGCYYPDIHEIPHDVAMDLFRRCALKVGGVDWGYGSNAAMVALGIDGDDRVIVVRDWSKPGHTADQMAEIARSWEEDLGITDWYPDSEDKESCDRWKGRIRGSQGVRGRVHTSNKAVGAGRDTERNCMRLQSRIRHPVHADKPGSWYYSSHKCTGINSDTVELQYADVGEDQEREERKVKPKSATHRTDARRYAIHTALARATHRTSYDPRLS